MLFFNMFLTVPYCSFPSLFRFKRDYAQQHIPVLLSSRGVDPSFIIPKARREGRGGVGQEEGTEWTISASKVTHLVSISAILSGPLGGWRVDIITPLAIRLPGEQKVYFTKIE